MPARSLPGVIVTGWPRRAPSGQVRLGKPDATAAGAYSAVARSATGSVFCRLRLPRCLATPATAGSRKAPAGHGTDGRSGCGSGEP